MDHGGELFNYPRVIVFMYWYRRSNLCPFKGLSRGQKQLNLKSNSNTWMILSICLTLGNHTFFSQHEDYSKYLMHQAHASYKTNISFFYFYFHFPESSSPSPQNHHHNSNKKKIQLLSGKVQFTRKIFTHFYLFCTEFLPTRKIIGTTPKLFELKWVW